MTRHLKAHGLRIGVTLLLCVLAAALAYPTVSGELRNLKTLREEHQALVQQLDQLQHPKGGVLEHGALSVDGGQLVDQHGAPVVLRGLSSHGLLWFPEYTNYRSLKTLQEYGANAFRVALYTDAYRGYTEEPSLHEKLLYQAIENALAADLYIIVDWHVLNDETPMKHLEDAKKLFTQEAQRYGDQPGILYEICNEPNGAGTYQEIQAYAKEIIPLIRKYAPNAVILVGTPKFCTSLKEAIAAPLPYPDLLYTYHYYSEISDRAYAQAEISRARKAGLGVFVSEWGMASFNASQRQDANAFLAFLNDNNISWINWALSNKDEGYSLLRPECKALSQWTKEDLTPTGQFVLSKLQTP